MPNVSCMGSQREQWVSLWRSTCFYHMVEHHRVHNETMRIVCRVDFISNQNNLNKLKFKWGFQNTA
jgi:hypothetical protein